MSPMYTFVREDGSEFDRIVPYDTETAKDEEGREGTRKGTEVPAKRNPAYGIQR